MTHSPQVVFTVEPTEDDLVAFFKWSQRRVNIWLNVVFTAFVGATLILLTSQGGKFLVLLLLVTALGVVGIVAQRWYNRRIARRAISMDVAEQWVVDANGINIETRLGSARIPWNDFARIAETRTHFFLRLRSGGAFIVPKRSLVGPNLDSLRTLLRAAHPNGDYLAS